MVPLPIGGGGEWWAVGAEVMAGCWAGLEVYGHMPVTSPSD